MENNGYIKLFRKIVDWEWYDDLPTFRLFTHLLLKVNYTDQKWRGNVVKRGSCITSFATLQSETKLSKKQIERALKNLIKTGEVEKVSSAQNTLIIVTNYDAYQNKGETNDTTNGTTNGATEEIQGGNEGETEEKQRRTNKKEKKEKKDKKEKKKTYIELINDYTSNDNLKIALTSFVEMRNKMKGFTERALELLLAKLDKLANDEITKLAIVNQSIEKSWKGFFELKKSYTQIEEKQLPDWYQDQESVSVEMVNDSELAEMIEKMKI